VAEGVRGIREECLINTGPQQEDTRP